MSYLAEIETRVAGIPCIICVESYHLDNWNRWETDIQYVICDRKGRPAPWLERKVTRNIESDIVETIVNYFN